MSDREELRALAERAEQIEATLADALTSVDGPLSEGALAMIRSLECRRDELRRAIGEGL